MTAAEQKRIGLLVPSSNTTMEPDFYRYLPPNITLHTGRMYLKTTNAAEEGRMLDEFTMPPTRDLATVNPDVIVFGCTSAGALRGRDYDRKMCARISEMAGCPAVSTIESVGEALKATGAENILILTPYVAELNDRIRASVEEDIGLKVINIFGQGIIENVNIAKVTANEILQFAREKIKGLNPDCLFFSCTNWGAKEAIPMLKEAFGLPVVSSNQAAFDKTMSVLGV